MPINSNDISNNAGLSNDDNILNNGDNQDNNYNEISKDESNNVRDENDAFLFVIKENYTVNGRQACNGEVLRGNVKVGDSVQIIGMDNEILSLVVAKLEIDRKEIDEGIAGQSITIIFDGIYRDQIEKGQVIAKPNSISAVNKFDADVKMV